MTKIEWADETWNPITGCSKISEGCRNCYAERMAKRLAGRFGYPKDNPFKPGTVHYDKIDINMFSPGKKIFVCSMGDLFHDDVKDEDIDEIFTVMINHMENTFMLLTKRPVKMAESFERNAKRVIGYSGKTLSQLGRMDHIWCGVTAENQEQADKRIPALLQIPAKVRFVSVEPMFGPIDFLKWHYHNDDEEQERLPFDWVICGGESGPGARPMHPDWVRFLRDQCVDSGVPFFFKQWGSNPHQSAFKTEMVCAQMQEKKYGRMIDGRTWEEFPK